MNCKTLPEALAFIAKKSGKGILRNRSHVIACLKDLLPEQKAARNILDAAFAMGIAEKFDEACGKAIHKQQVALSQCSTQLCDDHGFEKELVDNVLWAYGIAMGFDARPEPKQSQPQPQPRPVSPHQTPAPKPSSQPGPQPFQPSAPKPSSQPRPQPLQPPIFPPRPAPRPTLQPLQPPMSDPKPATSAGITVLKIIGVILLLPLLLFALVGSSTRRRRRSSGLFSGGSTRRRSKKSGWYN